VRSEGIDEDSQRRGDMAHDGASESTGEPVRDDWTQHCAFASERR
jgi:hypothetical protein